MLSRHVPFCGLFSSTFFHINRKLLKKSTLHNLLCYFILSLHVTKSAAADNDLISEYENLNGNLFDDEPKAEDVYHAFDNFNIENLNEAEKEFLKKSYQGFDLSKADPSYGSFLSKLSSQIEANSDYNYENLAELPEQYNYNDEDGIKSRATHDFAQNGDVSFGGTCPTGFNANLWRSTYSTCTFPKIQTSGFFQKISRTCNGNLINEQTQGSWWMPTTPFPGKANSAYHFAYYDLETGKTKQFGTKEFAWNYCKNLHIEAVNLVCPMSDEENAFLWYHHPAQPFKAFGGRINGIITGAVRKTGLGDDYYCSYNNGSLTYSQAYNSEPQSAYQDLAYPLNYNFYWEYNSKGNNPLYISNNYFRNDLFINYNSTGWRDTNSMEINKQKFVVVCEMNCDLLDKPKFDVNNDPDSVYKTQNQNYQAECDTKSNRQEAIAEDVDLEEAIASDYNVYENCKFPNIKYSGEFTRRYTECAGNLINNENYKFWRPFTNFWDKEGSAYHLADFIGTKSQAESYCQSLANIIDPIEGNNYINLWCPNSKDEVNFLWSHHILQDFKTFDNDTLGLWTGLTKSNPNGNVNHKTYYCDSNDQLLYYNDDFSQDPNDIYDGSNNAEVMVDWKNEYFKHVDGSSGGNLGAIICEMNCKDYSGYDQNNPLGTQSYSVSTTPFVSTQSVTSPLTTRDASILYPPFAFSQPTTINNLLRSGSNQRSTEVDLDFDLPLFGTGKVQSLWVSAYGTLSFNELLSTEQTLADIQTNNMLLAALLVESVGGTIQYEKMVKSNNGKKRKKRNTSDDQLLEAQNNVNSFLGYSGFTADQGVLFEWSNVVSAEDSSLSNSFQAFIVTDSASTQSFVVFNYENIDFTTSLNGDLAEVGLFVLSDDTNECYRVLNSTENLDLDKLATTTNIAQPGRWVMQLNDILYCRDNFKTACGNEVPTGEWTTETPYFQHSADGLWDFFVRYDCRDNFEISANVTSIDSFCQYDADYYDSNWSLTSTETPKCQDFSVAKDFETTLIIANIDGQPVSQLYKEENEEGYEEFMTAVNQAIDELLASIGLDESVITGVVVEPDNVELSRNMDGGLDEGTIFRVEFNYAVPTQTRDTATKSDVENAIIQELSIRPEQNKISFLPLAEVRDNTPDCLESCLGCQNPNGCSGQAPLVPPNKCCGTCSSPDHQGGKPYSTTTHACCGDQFVYDPETHSCCDSFQVGLGGTSLFTKVKGTGCPMNRIFGNGLR